MNHIVITGASSGIGKALLEYFVKENNVISIARRNIEIINSNHQHIQSDICQYDFILDQLQDKNITMLINNAGINKDNLLIRSREEDIISVLNTNLTHTILLTRKLIPLITRQGNIINISSIIGFTGNVGQTIYAASKAGLVGFAKSLARELARKEIRVNNIAPGYIETDMTSQLDERIKNNILSLIPLKRFGLVSDIVQTVCFLREATYITGETIHVNGGMYMN